MPCIISVQCFFRKGIKMIAVKKLERIVIYSLLAVFLVALFALPSSAAEDKKQISAAAHFTLPDGFEYTADIIDERKYIYDENHVLIDHYKQYSFVFPHSIKGREVVLEFSNIDMLYKDGKEYHSGKSYLLEEGEYTISAGGKEHPLIVKYTSDIPQMYLTLEDELSDIESDKSLKTKGKIVIKDGGTTEYDGALEYIKCRGNSSFLLTKKSYNIKLAAKTDMFGMGASRKYAVMPFYFDFSSVREPVAALLGKLAGIEYCMDGSFVDMYVNGEYRGLFYLTERVEIDPSRISIFDLEDVNGQLNPKVDMEALENLGDTGEDSYSIKGGYKWVDIPNTMADSLGGGYLLEYDLDKRYDAEKSGFVSNYGQPVVIKSPEYATKGQVEYIREYYQQFEDALLSDDGYNAYGKHYSDYINVESFAKMYVFQEYALNLDAAMSSAYMYKDVNGKLTMCTVWDMDNAFGRDLEIDGISLKDPEAIWATVSTQKRKQEKCIFTLLCQHEEFRQLAAKCWEENFAPHIDTVIGRAAELEVLITDSAAANQLRWIPDNGGIEIFTDANEWLREFLQRRAEFMSEFFSSKAQYVSYKRNGAEGVVLDKYSYMPGSEVVVAENGFDGGNADFTGWNTKADGSGKSYQPGDIITIEDDGVVLYAQWNGLEVQDTAAAVQPLGLWHRIKGWFASLFLN